MIPYISKGAYLVLRQNKQGEETFIYSQQARESCALSLDLSSMQKPSEIKAIAGEEVRGYGRFPIQQLEVWQQFGKNGANLFLLIKLVDSVAENC